ncbi:MAG: zinc metallopeptidase [Planctomycetes bacterium]|nr:zinc metallopeptidase [Planctomycetota bacterium]
MFFDPLYWLMIGAGLLLSIWASVRVKSTFAKYSKLPTRSQLTGAEVAAGILRQAGIHDVTIERVAGELTDHYDPKNKVLRLSEPIYAGRSMAAFGVAAHEVGHAIQHAEGYSPLKFRSAWVPVAGIGSNVSIFVIIAAFFLGGMATPMGAVVGWLGLALFATATVFTLVTLPVEFDASRRALLALEMGHYVYDDELQGARRVLSAAAMTYVAAFVTSLLTLLYWAERLGVFGSRR